MDNNKSQVFRLKAKKVIEALKKNNMNGYYVDKKEDVVALVKSMMKDGNVVSTGGSMTLAECGVMDLLRSGAYKFLDRAETDDIEKLYRDTFSADCYLTSTNAVTLNGELYNVDGNSNRVAAICFGPEKVIVVAGINKIVDDIESAIKRVKSVAAPPNCVRLQKTTYCQKTGTCMGIDGGMCDGCNGSQRICCNYVVSAYQRKAGRINVIIVGEELGY